MIKKSYSINELCKLTKVSVRTLHHYDEINILKPNHRTEKGHRRYSEDDLLQLQQIVTLKYMGFSLTEIKKVLMQKDFNFFDSLKIQENALLEKITSLQKITKLINYLINQNELNQSINWESVIQITEILKLSHSDHQQWYKKYLTENEQKVYEHHGLTHVTKWENLLKEAQQNINSGVDDERDIEFIKKLLTVANELYGNPPDLVNKLWEAFKAGVIPGQLPNNKDVITYITKSFEKWLRQNDVKSSSHI